MRHLLLWTLLVSIAFVACRRSESGIHTDNQLAPLTPSAATAVAGVDLDRLKQAALYQRHSSLLDIASLNSASQAVGLDPRSDVASLQIFLEKNQPVVQVRGSFSN